MKNILILITLLVSQFVYSKEIFKLHYMGDLKPLVVQIPSIINKDDVYSAKKITTLTINFDPESTLGLNAEIQVILDNKELKFQAKSINKSIVILDKIDHSSTAINAYIKFVNSEEILAPISNGLKELKVNNNILSFYTGRLSTPSMFNLKLIITRKKFIKKDEVIINKALTASDYVRESVTEKIDRVSIDLNKIDLFNANKKYVIEVLLNSTFDYKKVINQSQLGDTEFYQMLTIRP